LNSFLGHLRANKAHILNQIRDKKQMDDETRQELISEAKELVEAKFGN